MKNEKTEIQKIKNNKTISMKLYNHQENGWLTNCMKTQYFVMFHLVNKTQE